MVTYHNLPYPNFEAPQVRPEERERPMAMDPVSFRQSILRLIEADAPREEKLLADLEEQRNDGDPLYSTILYILTHLSFSEAEARRHWRRIGSHRSLLRMQLGLDVGLRVSLLDYFVNINRELKNPKVIEISIYERTERSAITDGLTGLYNHAYFLQALKREVQRSRRHGLQLSVAMLDLDDFKRLNDTRGHLEGDRVLVKTANLIQKSLREIDIAARYGGEEFAVILPDTPRIGAYVVADRIRAIVEQQFLRRHISLSGGVATFPEDATAAEDLIRKADEGLYRSKAAGKNRISPSSGERRRHPRVPTDFAVTVRPRSGVTAIGRAKNLSEGGLLLSFNAELTVGSQVSLVLRPRAAAAFGLRGEVVRVDPSEGRRKYDIGVRLLSASPESLLVLRSLAPAAGA